ncbi:MAG: hypothetical protein K6G58_09710 [Lachnospiraceae bacterium]|nr:hypothetical protein [Lachnospiraceae bacterium]
MRNHRIAILFCMISVLLLAGCAGRTDGSDASDGFKDKLAAASEKGQAKDNPETAERAEDNPETAENAEDVKNEEGKPNLLLFRQNAYEWNEDGTPAIKHQYTYFMLDWESAAAYKALAASLEDARDEMLSKQQEVWEEDLKSIEENGMISFDESWEVYLRRADEKYLSFVSEFCSEGLFDDGAYTEYTAHSYNVDSGKEIAFSDVIADENAFFDLLADKMYESINSKLRQYYSSDIAEDKESFKNGLWDLKKSGGLVWTLDPFGVTCYLSAYTKAPFAESAVIQFSEDADHVIFTDEYRDSAKDEYVIQVPENVGSYIDVNDSGVPEYVDVSEFYDYDESYDEMVLSGLRLSCGGDWKNIPTAKPGGTDFVRAPWARSNG